MPDSASLVDRPCQTRRQSVSRRTGREQISARDSTVRMWITGASLCRAFRGQHSCFEHKLVEKEIRQLLLFASGQIDRKGRG
jgi:hypothetical protein